jgi:enediyne biosynthesis protein E4
VAQLKTEAGYAQRKIVYRNLGTGRFEDVTERLGAPVTTPAAGRGAAFADLDNDGDTDVVVNNVNAPPDLFRLDGAANAAWITFRLIGTRSNRNAIGARVRLITPSGARTGEVRGGGSYYAQNDLRVPFGLGTAPEITAVEVRWPNGLEERWPGMPANRIVTLTEGTGSPVGPRP